MTNNFGNCKQHLSRVADRFGKAALVAAGVFAIATVHTAFAAGVGAGRAWAADALDRRSDLTAVISG